MIAEGLAEQGIASIRYDKRGIGENTALIAKEEDLTAFRKKPPILKEREGGLPQ